MAPLRPTARLAERVLLPDDPGEALALAGLLFDDAPLMFNHHRGLWGYSGVALDGAPLTVQSTGIGGPGAALVIAQLAGLGVRRAIRVGRAWSPHERVPEGALVAAQRVLARDGTSRALGAGDVLTPASELAHALAAEHHGAVLSVDHAAVGDAPEALAVDLESAAVLAAAARAGIRAASLVFVVGAGSDAEAPEGAGAAALAAVRPLSAAWAWSPPPSVARSMRASVSPHEPAQPPS